MTRMVVNLVLRLLLVCAVAAVGLGFTYAMVKERIEEQERRQRTEAAEIALAAIKAQPREDPELTAMLQPEYPELSGVFDGLNAQGDVIGYAFVVKSKGYNFITMAVGVDLEGRVAGIKVVTNNETPGLGAPAAESPVLLDQFIGRGPDPFSLGENVDGISSATYTSRGITDGVNMALEIWGYLQKRR